METSNELSNIEPVKSAQLETGCDLDHPENYSLSADKLSRNRQKIERRQFKDRISDRRSTMRVTADGKPQPDRRKANRVAYAEMYSRLRKPH